MVNDERVQRYAEAIHGEWWSGASDYADRAVAAVMAVADAEQAELRAEVERLKRNTAGLYERAHAAERALAEERAKVERVEALVGDWQANGNSRELGDPTAETWQNCARQLLDALSGDAAKPCGGRNSNVCVAEGCFGEACIKGRA